MFLPQKASPNMPMLPRCCMQIQYEVNSTLACKIPWTEEPGRLQTMGSLGVRHD